MITKMWDEYGKQDRMEIRISFKEGGSLFTHFTGNKEEAEMHFIGKKIGMGNSMKTCTAMTVVSG